jgi:DNA polymerase-3 subunit beta
MEFRVEHGPLAEAVAWVARALPSRPVVPVLAGLRLDAGDGLALSCFDYELAATVRLPAEVAEPGSVLVPGRLLAEITRSLPGLPARFRFEAPEVTLTCGSAEFTLVSLPLADYPELPPPPPLAGTVDGGELAAAAAQVLPAASRDDTLPVLTAVCFDIHGERLTLAATDRYRLAVRDLRWQPTVPGLRASALVPARLLAEASRIMSAGVPVEVAFTAGQEAQPGREARPADGMIGFASGERRLAGRLIAGEFVRYESRFPAGFSCQAELLAGAFTEAVRRVSLAADRGSPVRLRFTQDSVVIEARAEGRARAVETVAARFTGDQPAIAFHPQYLLDGLVAAATSGAGAGPARGAGPDGTASPAAAGAEASGTGEASGAAEPASGGTPVTIRLEFTTPARPALITLGDGGGAGDGAATSGASPRGGTAGPADGARPAFRYLVVPLRPPGPG